LKWYYFGRLNSGFGRPKTLGPRLLQDRKLFRLLGLRQLLLLLLLLLLLEEILCGWRGGKWGLRGAWKWR
jgi:hypothetical protein